MLSRLSSLLKKNVLIFICFILIGLPIVSTAEDGEASNEKAKYIQIKPSFVTNFDSEKLRFVKADVAIKVRGNSTAEAIEDNLPWIKHRILMLLSKQDIDGVSTAEGQSLIKEEALNQVLSFLEEEGLDNNVEEILFTGFLVE